MVNSLMSQAFNCSDRSPLITRHSQLHELANKVKVLVWLSLY